MVDISQNPVQINRRNQHEEDMAALNRFSERFALLTHAPSFVSLVILSFFASSHKILASSLKIFPAGKATFLPLYFLNNAPSNKSC